MSRLQQRLDNTGLIGLTHVACLLGALVGCGGTTPSGIVSVGGASGSAGAAVSAGGASAGAPAGGSAGSAGAGAAAGAAGSAGAGGASVGGSAGSGGSAGLSGSAGSSGAGGMSGAGGDATAYTGPSKGCGLLPDATWGSNNNVLELLNVPSCGTGPITSHCVAPAFSEGGAEYVKNQQWTYNDRNLGIRLPANYDPNKAYPVFLEGGGCSTGPDGIGGGYSAGEKPGDAIRVGLSKVGDCFADGGIGGPTGHGCALDAAHIGDCLNTPEVPYVNAVLDWVEARLCVDQSKVYIGGYSSGAWEAPTVSCALANRIRGMSTVSGGLRIHRPACTGPTAAFMIVDGSDGDNPIGPLVQGKADAASGLDANGVNNNIQDEDSYGSAPMRDELLTRNGCQGTNTAVYDPAYPQCLTYTGCPKAYPVVWCVLPGQGHAVSTYQNTDYGREAWSLFANLPQ